MTLHEKRLQWCLARGKLSINFSERLPAMILSQSEDIGEGPRKPGRGFYTPGQAWLWGLGECSAPLVSAPSPCRLGREGPGAGGAGVLALSCPPLGVTERSGPRGPLQEQSPPSSRLLGSKLASDPELRAGVTCELSRAALPRGSGRVVSE